MKNIRKDTGYTLIELLLYTAVIAVLLGAVTVFFGLTVDSRIKNQTINEVNSQGTAALDYITQTVRNSTAITSPAIGTPGSQLTVTVPTGTLSPTLYSVASGVLQVKEGTSAAIALTNSKVQVTSFTVTNLTRTGTSGIVQISLTLSHVNTAARNEYDYTRTFTTSVGVRP